MILILKDKNGNKIPITSIRGEKGDSVADVKIEQGELICTLSNGEIINAGVIEGVGGSVAPSDWAINDETAAGYVKNRTHYDMGTTYIPERDSEGNDVYWNGTPLEVTEEEGLTFPEGTPENAVWYTRIDASHNDMYYATRISKASLTKEEVGTIGLGNVWVESVRDDEEMEEENYQLQLMKAYESFLFADSSLTVELRDLVEINPQIGEGVGYGLFIMESIGFLVVLNKPLDAALMGLTFEDGITRIAPPGIYIFEYPNIFVPKQIVCEKVKFLESKYIPNYPNLSAETYEGYSLFTVQDKYGISKVIRVRDGEDGQPGTNGKNGATFTPQISNGYLSWTNDGYLSNPAPVKIQNMDDEHIKELIVEVMGGTEW